jgi:hypothetical protein
MDISKPLIQPTEEKQTFQWSSEAAAAIWSLKKSLCMAVILGCMWPGEGFVVDTVIRSTGFESKLSQMQEGQESVIAYCSGTLSVVERNYFMTRWELLAIVKMEYFQKYFHGQAFHVCTDHSVLICPLSFKTLEE